MADHRRKILGVCRFSVASMNDSVQDSRRLFPLAGVGSFPFPEAVWIFLRMVFTFIPTYFTIIRDAEGPAVSQRNIHDEIAHYAREDLVFVFLTVHKGECVVVVHCDDDIVLAPDTEKCGGDNVAEGGLGIVGYGFAEGSGVVASAEEVSLPAEEGDKVAFLT